MYEQQRQNVENAKISTGQASTIFVTAGLAAAILLAAAGWQLGAYKAKHVSVEKSLEFQRQNEPQEKVALPANTAWRDELARLGLMSTSTTELVASSSDPIATFSDSIAIEFINNYITLKQSGEFSDKAAQVGKALGETVRVPSGFTMHAEDELTVVADASKARVLQYRADMREALKVLVNAAPPEFETFALYIETKNPQRLVELEAAIKRYRGAEKNALAVIVPNDAEELHIRVVNALGSYAYVVEQLVRSVNSPVTTLGVLRTYNEAEREMLYAFDALASYYVRKSSE